MLAFVGLVLVLGACESIGTNGPGPGERRRPAELQSRFTDLTTRCFAADMATCDEISILTVDQAPTPVSEYGDTCGGRVEAGAGGTCTTLYPSAIPGRIGEELATQLDDLEELASECEAGELPACDELLQLSPEGTPYHDYAARCGGRTAPGSGCVASLLPAALPLPTDGDPVADDCLAGSYSACDELAASSVDQELQTYGATCGGRIEAVDSCVTALLGALPEGESAAELEGLLLDGLEDLAHACLGSDVARCDELAYVASEEFLPGYHQYGATCGERLDEVGESCMTDDRVSHVPPAQEAPRDELEVRLRQLARECFDGKIESCARLVESAGPGYEEFREYGESCGDRPADQRAECTSFGTETTTETPAPTDSGDEDSTSPGITNPQPTDVSISPSDQVPLVMPIPVNSGVTVIVAPPPGPTPSPEPVQERYKVPDEVLRAIVAALQDGGMKLTFHQRLRVDETTEVTVSIRGFVPVEVPGRVLRRISSEKTIEIVIPVRLVGSEIGAGEEERRVLVELEVGASPALLGTEIGTFALTPRTAKPSILRAIISGPELNRTLIELDYEIQLGLFEVEDRPWWERFAKATAWLAGVIGALILIAKPLGGLRKYKEWRHGTQDQTSGEAKSGPGGRR